MAIDFLDTSTTSLSKNLNKELTAGNTTNAGLRGIADVLTSKDISGVELRMLAPLIKDNHTPKSFLSKGFANLYGVTIVVSDVVNQLAGALDIKGFPRIGDHEFLPVNKTVFYFQKGETTGNPPSQVHIMATIIKSKEGLRNVGEIMGSINKDEGYKSLIGSVGSLVKDASKFNVISDVVLQVAGIVGKYLGKVEDKALGTVINSYTTLHGDFDKLGINSLVYPTRDVDFNFDLVVRDKTVVSEPATRGIPQKGSANPADHVEVDMMQLW